MSFDRSLQFQIRMMEVVLILIIYSFTIIYAYNYIVLVGREERAWFTEMQMIWWGVLVVRGRGDQWLNPVAMTKKCSKRVAQNLTLALSLCTEKCRRRWKVIFFFLNQDITCYSRFHLLG